MYITALILLLFLVIILGKCSYKTNPDTYFFSKDYTTVMKGFCCIIVIFVHIPLAKSNPLQDAVGSFGYICVTLFFLFSAYGLKWSVVHKESYLNHFFQKRILTLIFPYLIVLVLKILLGSHPQSGGTSFVLVLLLYYAIFYLSYKFIKTPYQDITICGTILLISLLGQLKSIGLGWYPESLGFLYGIFMANHITSFKNFTSKNFLLKTILLIITSILLGIFYLQFKYIWFWGEYLLKIILGISIILLLFTITTKIKIGNLVTIFLGNISYEIFLLHGLAIFLLDSIIPSLSSGIYILAAFLLSIIFASLFHFLWKSLSKSALFPKLK